MYQIILVNKTKNISFSRICAKIGANRVKWGDLARDLQVDGGMKFEN